MANSSHHHEHDGHEHTHDEPQDHSHGPGEGAPRHGHAHGEPTGNSIEANRFTRSQFLRMCQPESRPGGGSDGGAAQTQAPKAPGEDRFLRRPRSFSTDQRLIGQFLKKEGIPVYEGAPSSQQGELKRGSVSARSAPTSSSRAPRDGRRWVAEIRREAKRPRSAIFSKRTPWSFRKRADPGLAARSEGDMLTLEWEKGAGGVFRPPAQKNPPPPRP